MALLSVKHWDRPFLIDDEKLPLFDTGSVISTRGRPTVKRYVGDGRYDQRTLASFLMDRQAAAGEQWTHVNGDPMDFRCENLRLERQGIGSRKPGVSESNARRAAAQRATGKMVGVRKHGARYYARITGSDRKMVLLGSFMTEEEAGRAYDRARAKLGLPPVNFPGDVTEASGLKVD
ncbi:hypothetical protein Q0M94_06480 [Deinococcus radiomollis]|uniref:hypothetical protein n=1 Tax=Deinococcus radiomollis TaxID=468916 RepID=UPI0038915D57